jgi:hypothetical protein
MQSALGDATITLTGANTSLHHPKEQQFVSIMGSGEAVFKIKLLNLSQGLEEEDGCMDGR